MKKERSREKKLGFPVHLYREDLIEIEETLSKTLKPKEVVINFGEYKVTSFSEIPEETRPTSNLTINTSSPFLSLEITKYNGKPTLLKGDSLEQEATVAKLTEILETNYRKRLFYTIKIGKILSFTLFAITWFTICLFPKLIPNRSIGSFILLIAVISFFSFVILIFNFCKSKIEFIQKNNRKNFIERNKDQILVGVITGLTTSAIAGFVGYIIGNSEKNIHNLSKENFSNESPAPPNSGTEISTKK